MKGGAKVPWLRDRRYMPSHRGRRESLNWYGMRDERALVLWDILVVLVVWRVHWDMAGYKTVIKVNGESPERV